MMIIDSEDRGIRSRFGDLGRESGRAVETVRDITDQVQPTVELADSMKTDQLNATIYVLTVVATVLVVPTLIAGIYGMNFRVIPGARVDAGFWVVILVMLVVSVAVWFGIRKYLDRVFRQTRWPGLITVAPCPPPARIRPVIGRHGVSRGGRTRSPVRRPDRCAPSRGWRARPVLLVLGRSS
jgi:hypothetical protein